MIAISGKKWKFSRSFDGLLRFQLTLLGLFCLDAIVEGGDALSKVSRYASGRRPEETFLRIFAKSFDPQNGTVSYDCQRDSAVYRAALLKYKPWALQMYDASTKIPSGVITGNYEQLGNYDECLRVRTNHGFVGKACSVRIQFLVASSVTEETNADDPDMRDLLANVALASGLRSWTYDDSIPYEWMWCVPSSCSARDVANATEAELRQLVFSQNLQFSVKLANYACHTEESDRAVFYTADWIYIALLVLFGVVILSSTVYDLIEQRHPTKPDLKGTKDKVLTCFSIYTNGKSLLNVQRNSDTIGCLDGIRFFTICWIIYGHTVNLQIDRPMLDLSGISTMQKRWDTLIFLNNNIGTDTFFLLSGTLLAYSEMRRKANNPEGYRFKFWKTYIHRYLRLTPTYAMLIGFYATLFCKIGSGPRWDQFVGVNSRNCVKNWWTNLLYINNYVDLSSPCMSQSWYLAADMQMVWLSPIFLYPMLGNGRKRQMIFFALLATALAASVLTPFLVTYYQKLSGTMLIYKKNSDVMDVFVQIYTRVYTRGGSFLVGLGLGYLLKWTKKKILTMHISLVICGWLVATAAGLAVIFGPRNFYFSNHEYNALEAAFYAGLHRTVFALAVAWIVVADTVFACAGPVGALLSWRAWIPFSKLTYSAYLSHYIILLYNVGSSRTPGSYTTFGCVHAFFGDLVLTLFLSIILYLCFELPFCRLDQLLITGASRSPNRDTLIRNESGPENVGPISIIGSTVSKTYDSINLPAEASSNSFALVANTSMNSSLIRDDKVYRTPGDLDAARTSDFENTRAKTSADNLGFDKSS